MPKCQTADLSLIKTADIAEKNTVTLDASAEAVFALFKDGDAWPKWYQAITKVKWTTAEPYGVGTTRTVWLGPIKVDEYFFDWEENRRFAFYFTGSNLPYFSALVEEYVLEPIGEDRCQFTYTVAYNPIKPMRLLSRLAKYPMGLGFKMATTSLQRYVRTQDMSQIAIG